MAEKLDYHRNAADCLVLADRATSSDEKALLIGLARAWLRLAKEFPATIAEVPARQTG